MYELFSVQSWNMLFVWQPVDLSREEVVAVAVAVVVLLVKLLVVSPLSYPQPTETEARADVEKGAPFGLTQRAQVFPEFDDDAVLLEGKSRCELLCFFWGENTNNQTAFLREKYVELWMILSCRQTN